jgi:hypothetical protein
MTKEEISKVLKKNNQVVEIIEGERCNQIIYDVYIYKRVSFFFGLFSRIKKTTFPFYFETKELAEEFLTFYPEIYHTDGSYWDGNNIDCYFLTSDYCEHNYAMVDVFKKKGYTPSDSDKYFLRRNGVWGGIICKDADYHTFSSNYMDYKKIFDLEGSFNAKETGNRYYYELTPKQITEK